MVECNYKVIVATVYLKTLTSALLNWPRKADFISPSWMHHQLGTRTIIFVWLKCYATVAGGGLTFWARLARQEIQPECFIFFFQRKINVRLHCLILCLSSDGARVWLSKQRMYAHGGEQLASVTYTSCLFRQTDLLTFHFCCAHPKKRL